MFQITTRKSLVSKGSQNVTRVDKSAKNTCAFSLICDSSNLDRITVFFGTLVYIPYPWEHRLNHLFPRKTIQVNLQWALKSVVPTWYTLGTHFERGLPTDRRMYTFAINLTNPVIVSPFTEKKILIALPLNKFYKPLYLSSFRSFNSKKLKIPKNVIFHLLKLSRTKENQNFV